MSSTEYPDLPPVAADAHGSARGTWLLWAGLMLATVLTWRLGEGSGGLLLAAIVLGIAFVKGAVVALEFMALRHAPLLWRALTMGWIIVVWALIAIAYIKGLAQ